MEHKLSLLDNALDSLNESLQLFQIAESEGIRRYKFAILNFCHFTEILFKYFVSKEIPNSLIYTTKKGEKKTISFWKAVELLEKRDLGITEGLKRDLEWIKNLRNDIEHYEFRFSKTEVELFSGKIFSAILQYSQDNFDLELMLHIDDHLKDLLISAYYSRHMI